jgi:hypothetical protein
MVVTDYRDENEFVHGFTWTEAGGFATLAFGKNMTGLRARTSAATSAVSTSTPRGINEDFFSGL